MFSTINLHDDPVLPKGFVMGALIVAALIGLIPAAIAKNKGRSFGLWWFYGAMIFIVALPHALLARPRTEGIERQQRDAGLKKCPYCAEFVKGEAVVCKHCGNNLTPERGFMSKPDERPTTLVSGRTVEEFLPSASKELSVAKSPSRSAEVSGRSSSFGKRGF